MLKQNKSRTHVKRVRDLFINGMNHRERRTFSFTAPPSHEEIPALLRFPDSGSAAAPPQRSIAALPLSGEKHSGSHRRIFSNNSVLTQKIFCPAKQKAEEPTDIL